MRLQFVRLVVLCGVASVLSAQQISSPIVDLKAYAKIEVPSTGRATQSRGGICDGAGNVYLRRIASEKPGQERAALPIRKISPEGNLIGSFRVLDAFEDLGNSDGVDVIGKGVFVSTEGRVFQVAHARGDVFVVEFAQDGSVKAKTKLATPLYTQPWLLAVFKSGEYLLTATTGIDNLIPYTAVFSSEGRLVRKIYEPEDEEVRQRSSASDRGPRPIGVVGSAGEISRVMAMLLPVRMAIFIFFMGLLLPRWYMSFLQQAKCFASCKSTPAILISWQGASSSLMHAWPSNLTGGSTSIRIKT